MWKIVSDWLLAFLNMARELQEHRTAIRDLEHRIRDMEEAIKLPAQEQRHSRELERAEREKLMLRLEGASREKRLLRGHRRKRK